MMYVIFNNDGSVKTSNLGEFIQQGSSNYNVIFVSIVGVDNYSVSGYCTLPNSTTEVITGVAAGSVLVEGEYYDGFKITLTANSLQYAGDLLMSIQVVQSAKRLVTYPITLTVNETGVEDNTELNITNGQLNSVLASLSAKQTTYIKNNFRSYADETELNADLSNLVEGQIVYVNSTKRFYKKTNNTVDEILSPFYNAGNGIAISGNTILADTNYLQPKLVSGTNIKTINDQSLLGSGNIVIQGGGGGGAIIDDTTTSLTKVWSSQKTNSEIQNVREVAEGKNKAVVINLDITEITSDTNFELNAIKKMDGTRLNSYAEFETYVKQGLSGVSIVCLNTSVGGFGSQNDSINTGAGYYFVDNDLDTYHECTVYLASSYSTYLKKGDNVYIIDTEVPDRWFNGNSTFYKLETGKVDLTYMVTTNTNQQISGIKTFKDTIKVQKYVSGGSPTAADISQNTNGSLQYSNNNNGSHIFDGAVMPLSDGAVDLGGANNKWKSVYCEEYLTDGTNQVSVADIVAKTSSFPTLNASDIDVNNLTEEQFNKISSGCIINGTLLNMKNPMFFPTSFEVGSTSGYGVIYGCDAQSFGQFSVYSINSAHTRVSLNTTQAIQFGGRGFSGKIQYLNGKYVPDYSAGYLNYDGSNLNWSNKPNDNLAPTYSSSSTYAVGDLVIYGGALYVCNTAITTAEAWDSSKWTATSVKDGFIKNTNTNQNVTGGLVINNVRIGGSSAGGVISGLTYSSSGLTLANGYLAMSVGGSIASSLELAGYNVYLWSRTSTSIASNGTLKIQNKTFPAYPTANTNPQVLTIASNGGNLSWGDVSNLLSAVSGYDATKTQTLKNINGTLTWVDD